MKKIATIFLAAALLSTSGLSAQNTAPKGAAAQAANSYSNDNFAWGIGLGMLAVVGVVVGVTIGTSIQDPSTFSH